MPVAVYDGQTAYVITSANFFDINQRVFLRDSYRIENHTVLVPFYLVYFGCLVLYTHIFMDKT